MPWAEQSPLDSAWAEFDANQAPFALSRQEFEQRASNYINATGGKKRKRNALRALGVGSVNLAVLLPLLPATCTDPKVVGA